MNDDRRSDSDPIPDPAPAPRQPPPPAQERTSSAPPSQRRSSPSLVPRSRRRLANEPFPGAAPGTLVMGEGEKPKIVVIDYSPERVVEREVASVDDVVRYLEDETASITWVDVRGLGDRGTIERLGEIFGLHPLALEDLANAPQRPKTDVYASQQLVIARMVQLAEGGEVSSEQVGILFGDGFLLTVQEEPEHDVFDGVRERIRRGAGPIRSAGSDYLAYALLDATIDGFYPVLDEIGERLEELEDRAVLARTGMSRAIHDVKRDLLTIRRAIWPQRDVVNALLRDDSPHVGKETRVYLRDTYDHAVQVMDMSETFREIASGLMDLYLSGVSNRMNEIMKVLTIISTIFLPITFIAGVYGMNFAAEKSPYNMPELTWRYGYLFALGLMAVSVAVLLGFFRHKGWLGSSWLDASAPLHRRPDARR